MLASQDYNEERSAGFLHQDELPTPTLSVQDLPSSLSVALIGKIIETCPCISHISFFHLL
jgi:hypothetical protein